MPAHAAALDALTIDLRCRCLFMSAVVHTHRGVGDHGKALDRSRPYLNSMLNNEVLLCIQHTSQNRCSYGAQVVPPLKPAMVMTCCRLVSEKSLVW